MTIARLHPRRREERGPRAVGLALFFLGLSRKMIHQRNPNMESNSGKMYGLRPKGGSRGVETPEPKLNISWESRTDKPVHPGRAHCMYPVV